MREEEFDLIALNRLLDEALEEKVVDSPPSKPNTRLPFTFSDTKLLEVLSNLLPSYLHQADVQAILDSLRNDMYSDVQLGSLREMHAVINHCRRCEFMPPNPMLPQWNLSHPDVVFIRENPSSSEASDKLFVDTLVKVGFHSTNICLTYTTRCPLDKRIPSLDEVENCSSYLYQEIQMLAPKLIVPMGFIPIQDFIPKLKITEEHGRVFWLGPWAIMPVLGPMHVLQSKSNLNQQFENDLASAYRFVYGDKVI